VEDLERVCETVVTRPGADCGEIVEELFLLADDYGCDRSHVKGWLLVMGDGGYPDVNACATLEP
jgi:hypothetical protein